MNALSKLSRQLEHIQVLGRIEAGQPVTETSGPDRLDDFDMDSLRIPNSMRTFALKVRRDSMIGGGIHPGDVVILDFEKEPKNKGIVAALTNGDSTLKRYTGAASIFQSRETEAQRWPPSKNKNYIVLNIWDDKTEPPVRRP